MVNSYPSINFSTSKSFLQPLSKPWRDNIAIVGEFTRGPASALNVTEQQFELLYGRDAAEGSVNVQQALSLGATNLTISRAVPSDSGSRATVSFASGNTNFIEPIIGYEVGDNQFNPTIDETNYTCGLSVDLKFIGEPIVSRSTYTDISTFDTILDHPSFDKTNEQGVVELIVTDFVAGVATPQVKHTAATIDIVTVAAAAANEYQVVEIDTVTNADYSDVDQAILPGYVLKSGSEELQIASKPFPIATNKVGVLVKSLSAITGGTLTGVEVYDPIEDVYCIGYRITVQQNNAIAIRQADSKYFTIPSAEFSDSFETIPFDAYFLLDANNLGNRIEFTYHYIGDTEDQTTAYGVSQEGFSATSTEGIQLLFGTEGVSGYIPLIIGGRFSIPLASGYITVGSDDPNSSLAYTVGTPFKNVVNDLYNSVLSSTTFKQLIDDVEFDTSFTPYSLTFNSLLTGLSANRIDMTFIKHVAGDATMANDIFIDVGSGYIDEFDDTNNNASVGMSGAFSGPRRAYRDFYSVDGTPILRVFALSPGPSNIKVSITPQNTLNSDSTRFLLSVESNTEGRTQTEVFNVDTKSVDINTGLLNQTSNSFLIRGYFIPYLEKTIKTDTPRTIVNATLSKPPVRLHPPFSVYSSNYAGSFSIQNSGVSFVTDVPLTGGINFTQSLPPLSQSEVRKHAYLTAVKKLASVDTMFVAITGITFGDPVYAEVFDEAIAQVNRATAEGGLRMLFLEAPIGMKGKQAEALSLAIDNPYVTIVAGHPTQRLDNGEFFRNVGCLGYYTANLAVNPPSNAPQAPLRSIFFNDIVSLDVDVTTEYKNSVTLGKVDSLYFDSGLNQWKFLNGLTTTSEFTNRYVAVNRIRLQIMTDLYNYLQWVRSTPNDRNLQSQVTTAIDAYLNTKLREAWITRVGPTICGPSNNSEADMLNGKLNIEIRYVPVIVADFISVNLIEDYTLIDSFSLQTAAG